jgi:putative redox protein
MPAIRGGLLGRSGTARRDQTAGPDTGVLACRIAGTLAEHHPGWRMPRLSVLARHYGVSSEGVAAAVEELQRRQLIRRLANGQFCRSSPAEYRIPPGSGPALSVGVYPVAGTLGCRSATVSHRPLREDAARRAIGSAAGEPGCTLRLLFTVDNAPAAVSTTYVTAGLSGLVQHVVAADCPRVLPLAGPPPDASHAIEAPPATRILQLELQCVAFYAGRYRTRHGYSRDGLAVSAGFDITSDRPARVSGIRLTVLPPADLPAGRRPALRAVVSHCTVHSSLAFPPPVGIDLI